MKAGIVLLACGLICQSAPTDAEGGRNPPNIVLLVTDDQRADAVGFLHPVLETPNMDRLAAAGPPS
jgi:hypothetical protein